MSVISQPAILGLEMAVLILWVASFFGSFCWQTPMPIKFLVLGGGGFWKGGGGSANSIFMIFMGMGSFLIDGPFAV